MLSYKYYLNTVTRTVSKYTATVLSYYHINIILTQSHVLSRSAALQPVFSHCAVTRHTKEAGELVLLPQRQWGCAKNKCTAHLQ